MATDHDYMARALSLGRLALGLSSPNPAVGAVLVKDGVVVGEGHTQEPGGPHAEVMALRQAGERARGATLYVTLEPCPHHGRTPPCADAIIAAGVKDVHMAVLDPNPIVDGRGRTALEAAGIAASVGQGAEEAVEHFQGYFKHIRTGVPLLIAKYAMSLDGKIATRTGDSKWVTGEEARKHVHRLRAQVDAILTAPGTVSVDDPQLTARDEQGNPLPRQPLRVIADSRGRTPTTARLFREPGRTLVATASEDACAPFLNLGEGVTARAFPGADGRVDFHALFSYLGESGVLCVMTEAGETLLGALFDAGLPDQAMVYVAPSIVGGEGATTPVSGRGVERIADAWRLQRVRLEQLGPDLLVRGAFRWWGAGGGLSA
jgi:diaminohydroxyphosphoribosylaminopyrimidine deaminase/5-amino-6-(5-phosphoribosylamino)uracil reductase